MIGLCAAILTPGHLSDVSLIISAHQPFIARAGTTLCAHGPVRIIEGQTGCRPGYTIRRHDFGPLNSRRARFS